jgi:FHA domain-containing protein
MSEIALTVLKVLFLALLWLFILSVVSVIRSDLFGRTVPAPEGRELEAPAHAERRGRRPRGDPRIFSIAQGNQAGLSAELAGGPILIGRGADCQLILDDDYVSTRHARVISGPNGVYV